MSRPSQATGSRKSSVPKSSNPIVAWFQKRKQAREQAKEDADRSITANKAENEEKIKNKLLSINFGASPLPQEVLDEKEYPEQPYGDIEFQVMGAIERIGSNTQDYSGLDISRIDKGIYQIAILTKQAIDGGNANAARAACHALSVTIGEIRDKIPSVPVGLQKDFIEKSEEYISVWMDYIQSCTVLDGLQDSVAKREAAVNEKTRTMNQERDSMAVRMVEEPQLKAKFERIMREKYILHGNTWDEEMKSLYKWLVDMRIRESTLQYEMVSYNNDFQELTRHKRILDGFLTTLRTVPQPQDKYLMNKFNELIQKTQQEAAEQDQQFDEFFQEMDRMEAAVEQLANSPGNLRARDEAQKQVAKIAELARQKQMEGRGVTEDNQGGVQIHLYTEEELDQIEKEHEKVLEPQIININTSRTRNAN